MTDKHSIRSAVIKIIFQLKPISHILKNDTFFIISSLCSIEAYIKSRKKNFTEVLNSEHFTYLTTENNKLLCLCSDVVLNNK